MPIGSLELLIVLVILLVVFGAGRLAGVGGALGRSVKEFRMQAGVDEMTAPGESTDKPAAETRSETTPTTATDTRR